MWNRACEGGGYTGNVGLERGLFDELAWYIEGYISLMSNDTVGGVAISRILG
jgi:hypothetical protein